MNKIEYELIPTKRGVLKSRAPFYLENNGYLFFSFDPLPAGSCVVRLSDKRGVYASLPVNGNIVSAPAPRLKAGAVNVELLCADNGETIRYVCEPFEIRNLGEQLSSEYEVAPQYDKLAERVDDLERSDAIAKNERADLLKYIRALEERDVQKQELIDSLIKAYNNPMG